MKSFLILLFLSSIFCQSSKFNMNSLLKSLNVTKAVTIRHSNASHVLDKIKEADVPEKVKEWVKTANPKKLNSISNIDLSYDKKQGGKAKGELYYYSYTKFLFWSNYVFNYGTVEAELKPIPVLTQRKCKGLLGNRKCHNVPYSPYVSEDNLKTFLNTKMREAIRKQIKKQNKTKPVNNTQKKDN